MPIPPLNPILDFLTKANFVTLLSLALLCLVIVVVSKYGIDFFKNKIIRLFFCITFGVLEIVGIILVLIAFFNCAGVNWIAIVPNFIMR